ncbi:anaerobic ribonucleoside-triphosphate reductase activating protein [Mycoplasma sp. P36-A1]|uniref:anaerobic ribonucleoside-triphosphate reductase activating protein n=1 Tax=Mycoplasma sp. P36-A1 TaxID=3252900 RepID=UPI003C3011F1
MSNIKFNLAGIIDDSIVDGPGLRTVFFFQGCNHNCQDCHNPQSHSFNTGTDYTITQIKEHLGKNPLAKRITVSGGEPFDQYSALLEFVKYFKEYHIWIYTGYTKQQIIDKKYDEVFEYIDALVDGRFDKNLKTLEIPFIGSSNQKIYYFKSNK